MGFDTLKTDNLSGASELLVRTANYWLDEIRTLQPSSLRRGLTYFRNRGLFIIRLYPRMAPLFHLVNRLLLAVGQATSANELKGLASASINDSLQRMTSGQAALLPHAASLVQPNMTVFTYSRSSVVMFVLLQLQQRNVPFRVLLTEARPMNEGLRAAEELVRMDIPVSLYVDAAMAKAVNACDLVLLGADTFSDHEVINKIGTKALCLLARAAKKPVYCLTTTDKYMPADYKQFEEPEHSCQEVWPGAPPNVTIHNHYFETTPMELVTDVITEKGLFRATPAEQRDWQQLDAWLAAQR